MISEISTVSEANEIIISRLVQSSEILPLNKYTHHAIVGDNIDALRSMAQEDYEQAVRSYVDVVGDVHSVSSYAFSGFSVSSTEAKRYMVYPFSRTNLYKSVYSDLLPSVFNMFLIAMKKLERLRQFGTGVGKAFLIRTDLFSEEEFGSLRSMKYKDVVDLMVVVSEQIAKQNTDVEYLLQRVDELSREKDFLASEIERLNRAVINTSITTWR
jgi:hypothetical protein